MTTLPEIDMQNTLAEYVKSQLPSWDGEPCWNMPAGRTGFTDMNQVEWLHQTVVKPTANQLITIYDTWIAAQSATEATETTIKTAQNGLKNKIALAEQFASSITAVLNASLQQTEDATTQPTRFNNIKAVMDAQPAAFRNRFNGDLLQEAEITIGSIVAGQFPAYCRYVRQWSTQLALLLVIRKALS